VESEVGNGSRFIVTIPWQKAKVDYSLHQLFGAMQEVKQSANHTMQQQNLGRILIVDDNEVNSAMLSDYLGYKGFNTVILSSGHEALLRIAEINPDVVLMDIQMPGIDGLEVIRKVRKMQGAIKNVGMIALTALAMSEDRQKCIDAGADDYVSKPVDLDVLMVAINSLKGRG
jgi:CheY-like chemotaxis protein